jgi:hypothetical protein
MSSDFTLYLIDVGIPIKSYSDPWTYIIECQPEDLTVIMLKFPDLKVMNEV